MGLALLQRSLELVGPDIDRRQDDDHDRLSWHDPAIRVGRTTLTLVQDNNATPEEAEQMAEQNWGPVLQGLKAAAEQR
jgi:hypothetical protein